MMTPVTNIQRRHILLGSVGAVGAAVTGLPSFAQGTAKPLPNYVSWKNPTNLIQHTEQTLETTRAAQGAALITPSNDLFVRNNITPPSNDIIVDPDAWKVSFEGFANPRTMTVGQLKTVGVETVVCVLQCSGNGRGFFGHKASGAPWETGAAGNVVWTGVPVRDLVSAMGGTVDGMSWLTGTGGEVIPEGIPKESIMVERSMPVEVMERAILAWEMNGEPISLAHGGPLRLIVPGYYGVNNVKYIKRLAFTAEESNAKIQQSGYRVRPVGEKGDASQPSMYEMNVKSWITSPLQDAATGLVQIHGLAMGGVSDLKKIEVSIDGGKTWQDATFLGPDLGTYAWRPFVLITDLKPGSHVLASRATNVAGETQPVDVVPNHRAYAHNGWEAHSVVVTVA